MDMYPFILRLGMLVWPLLTEIRYNYELKMKLCFAQEVDWFHAPAVHFFITLHLHMIDMYTKPLIDVRLEHLLHFCCLVVMPLNFHWLAFSIPSRYYMADHVSTGVFVSNISMREVSTCLLDPIHHLFSLLFHGCYTIGVTAFASA